MREQTLPFYGPPNQRGTGTGDERYVNVLFEQVVTPNLNEQKMYVVKRPGLANSTQPPAGAATGRGIYAWQGRIYSVFANKIYSGTTDLGVTLAASSGRVWFEETPPGAGTQLLIMSDGADNYNITTGDVITQIDENDDPDYPASNLGPIYYLDGYLFQAQSDGDIWNTDLNSATAWSATSFLRANRRGDDLEAIHLQKDQIIAFGKNSIEFYFNNGNPTGSPLLRLDKNSLDFGIATKNSLAWSGSVALFVGENSARGDGGRSVWMIANLGGIKEVSTPVINRFLAAEGSSISSCTAWMERVAGQLVYVLNLSSANRTFVFSLDTGIWNEWEIAAGGAKFNGIAATSLNGTLYIQDATNGRIYTMLPTTYRDSGTDFTETLQTEKKDFGTGNRKFESALSIVGDTTTGNLGVATSDDDYTTFSTARNIDMSLDDKKLTRMGSFKRRAYRYTFTSNAPLRLQASRHLIETGTA